MVRLVLAGCGDAQVDAVAALPRVRSCTPTNVDTTDLKKLLTQHADTFEAVAMHASQIHSEQVRDCIAAGKHLLLDSPVELPTDELRTLASDFINAGLHLAIARPKRFQPSIQSLKQSIDAGQLGTLGLVRIHRWEPPSAAPNGSSRIDRLADDVDLACWFIGTTPEVVFATASGADDDNVQVHVGFTGGAMALIDVGRNLPPGDDYFSLSVIGSTGSACADDHRNQQLVYSGGAPSARRTDHAPLHRVAVLQDFVDSIAHDKEPTVTIASVESCGQILGAAQRSLDSHESIQL